MTRRAKVCTGCGKPLGAARLVVHTAEGGVDGEYHPTPACFASSHQQTQKEQEE